LEITKKTSFKKT